MTSEHYVIGLVGNHHDQFFIARDIVTYDDFLDPDCKRLWQTICDIVEKGLPIVPSCIAKYASDELAGLFNFCNANVYGGNVEPYCHGMLQQNREIEFKNAISQSLRLDDPANFLQDAIEKYQNRATNQSLNFKELIQKTVNFMEAVSDGQTGIYTGFAGVDNRVGGLQKDRIMVVAARTAVGKTALTMQMALNVAKNKQGVGVCSLEMGAHELGVRALAHTCITNVSGLYRAEEAALASMSQRMLSTKLAQWPLYFNTEQYALSEILNQIRVWVKRDDVELIIVDHIGLIEVNNVSTANERLGIVTRSMKKLSKELHIPIILVSQLNRSNDKENRPPRLSDLRDSGSIEQDADIVLLLHKVIDHDRKYLKHELALAKNRQGAAEVIDDYHIEFDGPTQTFHENKIHQH